MRKYVILFGNMFNNISLVRKVNGNGAEIERLKIPIVYADKEKYLTRLQADPDLQKETQITLPRMSFHINSMTYDAARQQVPLNRVARGMDAARVGSQYVGVPYDFGIEMVIYARNIDDGNHILEQILPYFNPDYTFTITPVVELGFMKDIPLSLNGVTMSVENEGGKDSTRIVMYTLDFTMKGYFYGPRRDPKIIRKSIANIFNDPSLLAGYLTRINTDGGNNGFFKENDVVYQGPSYKEATAYGIVKEWSKDNRKLFIGAVQGQFRINTAIQAASTNANYNLVSFDTTPLKLVTIEVTPDPADAQPGDDFGYSVMIDEEPEND